MDTRAGIFDTRSVFHRVGREPALLLGTGRAILLHLAHPLIAAGVADHSYFQSAPFHRLQHTIAMMQALTFGGRHTAEAALQRFRTIHERVHGHVADGTGAFPAGMPYTALDPSLIWWVLAASTQTRLLVYERFVAPLSAGDRASYYADVKVLAQSFGVPLAMLPPTYERYVLYMADMFGNDTLAVTETARRLAQSVLYPTVRGLPRAGATLFRFVTIGLLPDRLRRAYGLAWDSRREAALNALCCASRALLPLVPASMRDLAVSHDVLLRRLIPTASALRVPSPHK